MKSSEIIDPQLEYRQNQIVRRLALAGILIVAALIVRFFQIQVIDGHLYQMRAARQSSRTVVVLPQRGLMLDRNGRTVIGNQPGFRLRLFPDVVTSTAETFAFLQDVLPHHFPELQRRFDTAMRRRPFRPETLVDLLSRNDVARLAVRRYEHPELTIQTVPIRRYLYGDLAAHLIGYLGEINDQELLQRGMIGIYAQGDIVGKLGLEREYDAILFGTKGSETYRVDANGRIQELLFSRPSEPGRDLMLSLDLATQLVAEAEFEGRRGALVALDPHTGEILAIVSKPSFSAEKFIGGINHADWEQLRDNPGTPLEYRAIRGQYPPGSAYKPLVALAALQEGVIKLNEKIYCPGHYRLGRRTFRCWKAGGHGHVDMHAALRESCDTYFYEIGKRLGIGRLADYGRRFGFGSLTGIDIGGEKPGLIPDPDWKQRTGRGAWQEGETIIAAIGQGSVLSTPLQLARLYAAIANGGWLVPPHARKRFVNTYRPAATEPAPLPVSQAVDIDHRWLAPVQKALVAVVEEQRGTGGWARIRNIRVAGKTGTAQVVRQHERDQELAENLRDHAWFAAYAPADAPRIAIAVIVENAGSGGSVAAPIARKVMETYLKP